MAAEAAIDLTNDSAQREAAGPRRGVPARCHRRRRQGPPVQVDLCCLSRQLSVILPMGELLRRREPSPAPSSRAVVSGQLGEDMTVRRRVQLAVCHRMRRPDADHGLTLLQDSGSCAPGSFV